MYQAKLYEDLADIKSDGCNAPIFFGADKDVGYKEAESFQLNYVDKIINNTATSALWFLEHKPLYTAGTSAQESDIIDLKGAELFKTGRGGQHTWHGPGQRVVYVLYDLNYFKKDVKKYVFTLEQWLINSLARFNIEAFRRQGRVGIWCLDSMGKEVKIAAIGVRLKKWTSFHGIALNVNSDLSWFQRIVPCGISEYGVTSMQEMQVSAHILQVDRVLAQEWLKVMQNLCE